MGLVEEIKKAPDAPGVYLMKDVDGEVIYVGKAISLRRRLRSYFRRGLDSLKTEVLMSRVRSITWERATTENEALFLENDLIKKWRPRFNILLKDDKSFPYIKVTQEPFPRVMIGRRRKRETGFDYFGPYTDGLRLREALKFLRRSFGFCTCRCFPKKRACLNIELGLCPGPCVGKRYVAGIRRLEDFLTSKDTVLIERLSVRMRALVKERAFEEAAKVRDQLEALGLLRSLERFDARRALTPPSDLDRLGLHKMPRFVEAFDISNFQGAQSVGSMVVFKDAVPDKARYRRFRIRSVAGIDDYAMIREVVRRRCVRLLEEGGRWPDLILIDGGLGHLEAAGSVLKELRLAIPIIALAKSEELVYTMGNKKPVRLGRSSKVLQLLMRVRDEAHRFALKYHHVLRKKAAFSGASDDGV
jgi:excinuclease ABC subunit C